MSVSNYLFPDVINNSSLGPSFGSPIAFPLAVEGGGAAPGTATVGVEYAVISVSQAQALFGAGSSLAALVAFCLQQGGVNPVYATASVMTGGVPTLAQRQAAWQTLEQDPNTRIRLTDASDEASMAALGVSCANAYMLENMQVGFVGLPAGSSKATCIATTEALNHNRLVFVCPGALDNSGTLWQGTYAAALTACQVATNTNIDDDMNLNLIPGFAGIENNALGQPLFLKRVVSGVAINDFEDLLQAGASPLMTDPGGGGLQITHLRMTYTGVTPETDYSYDALMTRLIQDQVFINIRQYALGAGYLDTGNTIANQTSLAAGIANQLAQMSNWISPIVQADGSLGYAVAVVPAANGRSVSIQFKGQIIRGLAQILVDSQLTIQV